MILFVLKGSLLACQYKVKVKVAAVSNLLLISNCLFEPSVLRLLSAFIKFFLQEELEAMSLNNSKKKQTRGGKAMKNITKKQEVQKQVIVGRSMRARKKYVTLVRGLKTCDMNLKKCSKAFGQKFACGSSVTGDDEITVQGDVVDDMMDFIVDELGIDDDLVVDGGDIKD